MKFTFFAILLCVAAVVTLPLNFQLMGRFDYWLRHTEDGPGIAQAYAAAAQAFGAVLNLIVGAALVFLTSHYAALTHKLSASSERMAETAASQLAASLFPALTFEFSDYQVNSNEVQVGITIRNLGESAAKITDCAFGGFVEPQRGSEIGIQRLVTVGVPALDGVFVGKGQRATALVPLQLVDGSPLNVLDADRKFILRVNCTDPAGKTRHSFIQRSDGNLVYRNAFASNSEMS